MQVTEQFDIIVIGAGASGLYAGYQLTQVKMGVLILEGQGRIGGRMYTNRPENFTDHIESGAEFIHGDAPMTMKLLKKADVEYVEMKGNTYQAHEDDVEKKDFFDSDWSVMMNKLKDLHYDMTFSDFLDSHFADAKYQDLKQNVKKFVEGYNAADIAKVSAVALREEWSAEEDPAQYRIRGGYAKLYEFLAHEIKKRGGVIKLNQKVSSVRWREGHVEIKIGMNIYLAKKCLITIPVSNLSIPTIEFVPAIPSIVDAARRIGFGPVVKINIEFSHAFWETEPKRKFKHVMFLFTDETIPTWWSQFPNTRPLLTGWIGGPGAAQLNKTDDEVLESAITSLANALKFSAEKIRSYILAWKVDQWVTNEYSIGAYSYEMINTPEAVKVLQQSVSNTLYFAGEAIYNGPHKGTVEAALTSGEEAAKRIAGE
jgi:monoamine oxidase